MINTITEVTANNVRLSLTVIGKGISFIWSHGILGSQNYEIEEGIFNWEHLSDSTTLIRYDVRGHGTSQATFLPEDYTWNNLALDLLGIADALGIEHFIVGGTSMGCGTALYAALLAPKRVDGLILANLPTAWELRTPQSKIYHEYVRKIENDGIDSIINILYNKPIAPFLSQNIPNIREIKRKHYNRINRKAIKYVFLGAAMSDLPGKEVLKSLKTQTQILSWVDDPGHPVSIAEEVNKLLPNSELHIATNYRDLNNWIGATRNFIKRKIR